VVKRGAWGAAPEAARIRCEVLSRIASGSVHQEGEAAGPSSVPEEVHIAEEDAEGLRRRPRWPWP
jgi:hypothetical protein